jgi:hypothetical protein
MTDLVRFNLLWLCHAMTAPVSAVELYYYDGRDKKFFWSKPSLNNPGEFELFDMVDLPVISPLSAEIIKRVAAIDTENSEIVEIPRLNVQDKVAVQLLFLSKFPGIIHEEQLRLAAEKQEDTFGFVLDSVLGRMNSLAPMEPYWEDFKLKTIQYYLEKFTGLVGITLRML